MRRLAATAAVLAAGLVLPAGAGAASLSVTNTNDSGPGSLRQTVAGAFTGDVINVPPGTYNLQNPIAFTTGIAIVGQGATSSAVTLRAVGGKRVICAANTAPAALERLRIIGGNGVPHGACELAGGGGVYHGGPAALTIIDSSVTQNTVSTATANRGGGGIANLAGALTIENSTVYANAASASGADSGGAGIFLGTGSLNLVNSTVSGNRLTVTGAPANTGGAAIFAGGTSATIDSATIASNVLSGTGGAAVFDRAGATDLHNTVVSGNTGGNCGNGPGGLTSSGFNAASDSTCDPVFVDGDDLPDPVSSGLLGPLTDNGGKTPTQALSLPPNALIDSGDCSQNDDQRGAPRPHASGALCDIGAFEFDGRATLEVPDCTREGKIPFTVTPTANGLEGFRYKVNGGPTQTVPLSGNATASGTLTFPEGRRAVEFWGDSFPTGEVDGGEFNHHFPTVVVDRTNPTVAVQNPNRFKVFVIKRAVKVNVNAADSISGLTQNPSGAPRIDTARRGTKTFTPKAVDLCDNAQTTSFGYKVLGPALGTRLVVEELAGAAKVQASQRKGKPFSALREPREFKMGSFVDSRRGRVRLTVSRTGGTGIQDSEFSGGLFQVLQSRKRSRKGLTELRLKGGSFRNCGSSVRKGDAQSAKRKKRRIRRLRGNGKGRYRTRGRYSAATVRGTDWTVEDRCDGTLTRVKRGRVAVRDFHRKKTIILRAGKRYLAKAP